MQRLYGCAFVHRRIDPQLVYVSRPRSFLKHYLLIHYLFIYDVILTTFRIILSTWLYNKNAILITISIMGIKIVINLIAFKEYK